MMNTPIRLLIVDDDEDDFYLTSEYINEIPNRQFDITWASSFSQGMEQLEKAKFDLCFFDFLLGVKTGIDLLKISIEKGVFTPIILLTSKGDTKVDMQAMKLGAMDYLVKSELDAEKLHRCIRYALERAQTLAQLRENENRLRNVFAYLKEAVILKSMNGSIFYYNKMAAELFGLDATIASPFYFQEFFETIEPYQLFKKSLEQEGTIENYEVALRSKRRERFICSINSEKQTDIQGNAYYLIVIDDITSRKKLERDRLLAEKSASTARLARTLAHEVRNPLTNIHLSLDQLEPELEDEELTLFTNIIRRNSYRINTLITELLDSFRPQETVLTPTSIKALLATTLNEAIDRINLKKIKLCDRNIEDCILQLDQSKIKIALLNLIINAVEAMEDEKGELIIRTQLVNNSCWLSIQDNGVGISSENLDKLFEPYFTLKPNGLGLGLATTLTILQLHNARIEVESELGVGTTFWVFFPLTH